MTPVVISLVLGVFFGVGVWLIVFPAPGHAVSGPPSPRLRWLGAVLTEAGYGHLNPAVVGALGVMGALIVGAVVVLIVPIPVLFVIAASASVLAAYGFVLKQRQARRQRLRLAWPGVIDHIRAGVRSGSDISWSISALPASLPPDISIPVNSFRANIEGGLGTDTALAELAKALADPVADRIVEVLRMAHDVGGTDLPDVLLSLQHSVRGDIAVREDAHAKQSWIRSAAVLAVSAPWVVLVVIGTRGDTASSYQSVEGTMILVVGALVSVIAFRMMRSIGALPEQRRWLA